MATEHRETTTETTEYANGYRLYLPGPFARVETGGEILTPAQYLARELRNVGSYWRTFNGMPVVRELRTEEGSYWGVFGSATLAGYPASSGVGLARVVEGSVFVRVDNGPMRPEWYEVTDTLQIERLDIGEDVEEFEEDGYPRLCEREHAFTEREESYLEAISNGEPEEIPTPDTLPFAEYWLDGTYLCSEHFDSEISPVAYVRDGVRGDRAGIFSDWSDIELHAHAKRALPDTVDIPRDGKYLVTAADRASWLRATGRISNVLESEYRRAHNLHLESAVSMYENGELSREETLALGVGESYLALLEERDQIHREVRGEGEDRS